MYVCMYVSMYLCMYARACVFMYVRTNVRMYQHIQSHEKHFKKRNLRRNQHIFSLLQRYQNNTFFTLMASSIILRC